MVTHTHYLYFYTFYVFRIIFFKFQHLFILNLIRAILRFIKFYPTILLSFSFYSHFYNFYFSIICHSFIFSLTHKHFISNYHNLFSSSYSKYSIYLFIILYYLMNLPVYILDFDNLIFHLVCIFWLNDMKIEILAIYIKKLLQVQRLIHASRHEKKNKK